MKLSDAKQHLLAHTELGPIIQTVEMPDFAPSGRVYYDLLESIVSQQLSVKIATIIFNRFLDLFPDKYPHPEQVLALDNQRLRSVGLSNQKAAYLQNVAFFAQQHDLESFDWGAMSDEDIIKFLTQIKGVGRWTTEMILMFTLCRPDVLPVDDLGIQQAMTRLFGITETGKDLKKRMIELAEDWRPYRTVASRYLWKWKDSK